MFFFWTRNVWLIFWSRFSHLIAFSFLNFYLDSVRFDYYFACLQLIVRLFSQQDVNIFERHQFYVRHQNVCVQAFWLFFECHMSILASISTECVAHNAIRTGRKIIEKEEERITYHQHRHMIHRNINLRNCIRILNETEIIVRMHIE